jgi:hypothetical protein
MTRLITLTVVLLWGLSAPAHHSVIGIYDDQLRFIAEVEVREFELIRPHPLIFVEVTGIPELQDSSGITVGETWTLEMDNLRELTALGMHDETFVPGDTLIVAVDPSRHTRYRENTLYIRAIEHPRAGFVYLHNVRDLVSVDDSGTHLPDYLHRINN